MSTAELNVKEAVKLAFDYVQDLFKDEQLADLGLEEVEYDDAKVSWLVTVGFSRPWDEVNGTLAAITGASRAKSRSFKVVKITGGEVVSLRDRSKALV